MGQIGSAIRLLWSCSTVVAVGLTGVAPSFAFCSEPSFISSVPEPPSSFSKPDAPFCLSDYSWSRKHSCDQWEIDSYISDINEYIRKLRTYVDEANEFASEASSFASEAFDYAQCEANAAKEPLE